MENQVKRSYTRFFAICKTHGFDFRDKVAEYTKAYTNSERDSLRSLSDEEYDGLLILMIELNKGQRKDFEKKPGDPQRKKLIAMAKSMFWGKTMEDTVEDLDRWIRKQKFKKGLMSHTPAELDLMVAIFEQRVLPDYYKSLNNGKN